MVYAHHVPKPRPPGYQCHPSRVADREAKALKINVGQACEAGLAAQVKAAREQKWLEENREAVDAYNAYIEEHGLA